MAPTTQPFSRQPLRAKYLPGTGTEIPGQNDLLTAGGTGGGGVNGAALLAMIAAALGLSADTPPEGCCADYQNVYEPYDKHGSVGRMGPSGQVSPGPTNGQAALDASVPVNEGRRVGYDQQTGEWIIFHLHRVEEYPICKKYWHGFVVGLKGLQQRDYNAAKEAGLPVPRKRR